MPSLAACSEPWPVSMMTGMSGTIFLNICKISMPSISSSLRSRMAASKSLPLST